MKITRDEALKISPDYVAYVDGDYSKFSAIWEPFDKLKRGQKVLTHTPDRGFEIVTVTSVNRNDYRAIDGAVVRVGNDEFTWRVDGCDWAFPIPPDML